MRTTRLKLLLVRLGLVAATALSVGVASAAPIASWDYSVTSIFTAATFTPGAGCTAVTPALITWGNNPCTSPGAGVSGIGISNSPRTGVIPTNGAAQPANTYTHNNNVINTRSLTSATIQAELQIKPAGAPASDYQTFAAQYQVLFAETENSPPCTVVGSPTPCNDIWVLQGSLNNSFTVGGDQYFFSFFASPALASLPAAVCTRAGAAPGCIGFTTVEGQDNAVNFLMAITSTPISVPEPSSLALLGIGLLGFVALRRRTTR